MREQHIEVKVGALVLAAVALFVAFVFVLGDFQTGARRQIAVDFSTSADLKEGAPVKVSGVTVGRVERVEFWGGRVDEAQGRPVQVRVFLDVEAAMSEAVRADAVAFISTLGILGEKYVEIEPGSLTEPPLAPEAVLVGEPPLRLELVARDLGATLGELSGLLRDNRGRIESILEHADQLLVDVDALVVDNREAVTNLLASLQGTVERLDRVLEGAEHAVAGGDDLRAALVHARSAAEKVDRAVVPMTRKVEQALVAVEGAADMVRGVGDDNRPRIAALLDRVVDVADDVKVVAAAIRDGRGSLGALLADQELYARIKETIADLQRHPWKFIWKE